jgi:predicted aspartyl protease
VADIPHQGEVYRPEHSLGDYQRTDGILFPHASTATGWGPKGRAAIESVEVNISLDDDRFEMPAGSTAQTPKEPRQATVPFTLDHNRMVVEAQFVRPDGTLRTARAWVDTGNQHLVLAESLARDLGLDLSGLKSDGPQDSADSSSPAPPVRLGGLPLDMKGIKVRVSPGKDLRAGVPAEATLPASAFRRDHVVFDYPALRVTVARAGALKPRGNAVPCRVNPETGLFLVAAVLDGETVQMGVDNGSAGTWVSETLTGAWQARHPDWPHATGALGSANFFGFSFETQGTLMRLPELRIGTLSARDVAVLGLPQGLFDWYSKKSAVAVAGFIGANVLKGFRIEIDFPNGMTYWEAGSPPAPGDLDIVGLTLRPEAGGAFTIAGVATKDGKPAVGGVQLGDVLIRVDALDAQGALMGQVVDALRGKPGATRTLVIEREGKQLTAEAKVARFP